MASAPRSTSPLSIVRAPRSRPVEQAFEGMAQRGEVRE